MVTEFSARLSAQELGERFESPLAQCVLLVGDDAETIKRLRLLLRKRGYETKVAKTGPSALEICESARPDTVLVDLETPGTSAHLLARQLRERGDLQDVLICALVNQPRQQAPQDRDSAFDAILTKPIRVSDLESVLSQIRVRPPEIDPNSKPGS